MSTDPHRAAYLKRIASEKAARQSAAKAPAPQPTRRAAVRRYSAPRRRACLTGGNCSSYGAGRSCGGHDCDGWS